MRIASRRHFIKVGAGAAVAFIGARGREAQAAGQAITSIPVGATDLILSSNENPMGPGAHVLDAVRGALGSSGHGAGRYFFGQQAELNENLGKAVGGTKENIIVGAGSSEILRVAADVFTTSKYGVLTPEPTFGTAPGFAATLGRPVTRIGLDAKLRVDLEKMESVIDDIGLVYLCNPNNPTATTWPGTDLRASILRMLERNPHTTILVDEAYHEYVTDPEHETMVPLALENPSVIVARTFSKAYGMAGLRVGYGVSHPDAIKKMSDWRGMDMFTSVPGRLGALAALAHPDHVALEVRRNEALRQKTREFFQELGFEGTESQANFVYIDIRRSNEAFIKACRERGVRIGSGSKLYPTHARVTIGTEVEMERAFEVFDSILEEA